jgi:hypothetical protein
VPAEVEEEVRRWMHTDDNTWFCAMPPATTHKVRAAIGSLVRASVPLPILITRDADLRPFMRRLIALEFPQIMVIAEAELLPVAPQIPHRGSYRSRT